MKNGNGQDTSDPSQEDPIMRWTRTEFGNNSADEVEAKKNELRDQVEAFEQQAGAAYGRNAGDPLSPGINLGPASQSADMFDARVERNNTESLDYPGSSLATSPQGPGGNFANDHYVKTLKSNLKNNDGDALESNTEYEETDAVGALDDGTKLAFGQISKDYQMMSPRNAPGAGTTISNGEDRHVTIDEKSNNTAKFQTASSFNKQFNRDQVGAATQHSFSQMKAHLQSNPKPITAFVDQLRKNISDTIEFVTYDSETRKTHFIVRDRMLDQSKSVFGKQHNSFDPEKPYISTCHCKNPVECQLCIRQQQKDTEAHLYPSVSKQSKKQDKLFKKFLASLMPNGKQPMPLEIAELVENSASGGRAEPRKEKRMPTFKDAKNPGWRPDSEDDFHIDYLAEVRQKSNVFAKEKAAYVFKRKSFNWLMTHMLSHSDLIQGCEVQIPEQVLYHGGAPRYFLKNDKEGCIVNVRPNQTSTLSDVRTFIDNVHDVRRRTRDAAEASQLQNQSSSQGPYQDQSGASDNWGSMSRGITGIPDTTKSMDSKGGAASTSSADQMTNAQMRKKKSNQKRNDKNDPGTTLTDQFYKEICLMRYNHDISSKKSDESQGSILGEAHAAVLHAWVQIDKIRAGDAFWNNLSCFQVYPQSRIGLGKTFKLKFTPIKFDKLVPKKPDKSLHDRKLEAAQRADAEKQLSWKQIQARDEEERAEARQQKFRENLYKQYQGEYKYDFQQFGKDDLSLQLNNPEAFCLKQCNKIGYFMQKVHEVEIVNMNVEFIQDETGLIQFYHASNIWVRCAEDHQMLNMKSGQVMQPKKLEDTLLASAREREQLNQGIGVGGKKLGERTRPLDWRLRDRRPLINLIRSELEQFISSKRSYYESGSSAERPQQDFSEFIKKYNAELVHKEFKPPAFLCLDRDNNIYDLQELKAEYARAQSERASMAEAAARGKAEQRVRRAFEQHLVDEMAKRSQCPSTDKNKKTADRAAEKSETQSTKSPLRIQETISTDDGMKPVAVPAQRDTSKGANSRQNMLQWLRAQNEGSRQSYHGDTLAGASSYRNTGGMPTLELDSYEQDSHSKMSASFQGQNSITSVAHKNQTRLDTSINREVLGRGRTMKASFLQDDGSIKVEDSQKSVDGEDDEVEIADQFDLKKEFFQVRKEGQDAGHKTGTTIKKIPNTGGRAMPEVSRKHLIKGFEPKADFKVNRLSTEAYDDASLEPSARRLVNDRSYFLPDESVQRHLQGIPKAQNLLNMVKKADNQFLDAEDVSDLKVHAVNANVRGLNSEKPKPRRLELNIKPTIDKSELKLALKRNFQVNTKDLVVPAIRYASNRPLDLQERVMSNVKSQQQLWSKARAMKRDFNDEVPQVKKVGSSASAVVLPAFRVNHQRMRDFESFKSTLGVLQGRDLMMDHQDSMASTDPEHTHAITVGAKSKHRSSFQKNARETGRFSLGPSIHDDYKKSNIAVQRAIIQRDLREHQEKLGMSRNNNLGKAKTDFIGRINQGSQVHGQSKYQSQLKLQKSMKAFKAMDLQDKNLFSDIKYHLDAQNMKNNNLLMNQEQRDQTENFMSAQLAGNIINPELSKATYHSQSVTTKNNQPSSSLQISQMKQAITSNRKATLKTLTDDEATTQVSHYQPASFMRSYLTATGENSIIDGRINTTDRRKADNRDMSEQKLMHIVGQAL